MKFSEIKGTPAGKIVAGLAAALLVAVAIDEVSDSLKKDPEFRKHFENLLNFYINHCQFEKENVKP